MSGNRVTFVGDAMATVVQGVTEVRKLIGQPPVIVGGVAVLARLSNPYRATVDLDLVDRRLGGISHPWSCYVPPTAPNPSSPPPSSWSLRTAP